MKRRWFANSSCPVCTHHVSFILSSLARRDLHQITFCRLECTLFGPGQGRPYDLGKRSPVHTRSDSDGASTGSLPRIADFRPTVSGHRLLELTTVTLKNEASAIQEYSFG